MLQEKEKHRLAYSQEAFAPLLFDEEKKEEEMAEKERIARRREVGGETYKHIQRR